MKRLLQGIAILLIGLTAWKPAQAQVQIAIAKQAGVVDFTGNNTYEIPYLLTIKNLGLYPATNVQVTENLLAAFPVPVSVLTVLNQSADAPLTLNPAFDGKTNTQLLTGNNTLPVGTTAYLVRFTVRVNTYNSSTITFNNSAVATIATTPGGPPISADVSENGTEPDPNGNGNPNDAGEADPTPVSIGATTSFFCKGISGPNLIVNGDFGSGASNVGPPLPAGTTDYAYSATDLSVDGSYSIVRDVKPLKSDWTIPSDHTGNPNGYYMAINAAFAPGIFFQRTVTGLCQNTTYEFSVWVRNQHFVFTKPNKPLIEFLLNGSVAFTATPVPENNTWVKQGFVFNSGNSSTITIAIRNAELGGSGNDLGIDDLTLNACLPNPLVSTATLPVCPGNDAIVSAEIPDYNTNYANWNDSQWERSTNGGSTWIVVGGPYISSPPPFSFNAGPATLAMNGYQYRLKVATTPGNLTTTGCFSVSGAATLKVGASVNFTTTVTPPTCALGDGKVVLAAIAATDSVSLDGSAFTRANTPSLTFSNLNAGTHTISVRRFPCQKDTLLVLKSPGNCNPLIGIAKRVSPAVLQADGSFNATYSFVVKNYGVIALTNVQVTDNLTADIPAPSAFSVVTGSLSTTGSLLSNTSFNGNADKNLLTAGSTLAAGASQAIVFTINIKPNGFFGPYNNTAAASGTGNNGSATTATSTDGNDPDPNNNGIPNEPSEQVPTPLRIDARPVIGAAKTAAVPVLQDDDSYDIAYTLILKNYGNTDLGSMQVTDDLAVAFPAPLTYTFKSAPVATGHLAANPAFNGSSDKNLLQPGSSTLAVGERQTVFFVLNVKLNGGNGTFSNSVTATGKGPGATGTTTDLSNDGTDPDPNGNNNPSDPGEDKSTAVVLPAKPVIGLAKAASPPALQPNGSYNLTYTFTLTNLGSEDLINLKLSDNLVVAFPAPVAFSVVSPPIATGNLTAQSNFNGTTVTDLLAGNGGILPVGASATVSLVLNLVPNGSFGPFANSALASGQGIITGVVSKDISNAGTDPDPNHNHNPSDNGNEDNPTTVSLSANPVLGIAKLASQPVLQGNGSYNLTFTLTLKNLGNVALTNVQATDNLKAAFPAPVSYSIISAPVTGNGLLANPAFNGTGNQNLLAAGSTLSVGATATVVFNVNVVPNGSFGPFTNIAFGSGTGGGLITSDLSNDGNDPDPDHDNDPSNGGNNDQPTVIRLAPNPTIGIAETAGTPVLQADGSYNVVFTIIIENLGNVNLSNVQVTNNLPATFPAPSIYKVITSASGSGLSGNPGFDGASITALLAGSNTLNTGEKKTFTFTLNILPNGVFGPFENSSIATATGAGGTGNTTDISNDGTLTDPNGNGNPTEPSENTPTPIRLLPVPRIGIAKAAGTPVLQANGSYNLTYTLTLKNLGNVDLTNVQVTENLKITFPAPVAFSLVGSVALTGNLVQNPGFNGNSDTRLLNAASTLATGTTQTLVFTVNVIPNGNFGAFSNAVLASADGVNNTGKTSDLSTNGTNPDPDGNGNADEPGNTEPTVVTFISSPLIGIAKAATAPVLLADGSYTVTYTFTVKNYGNVSLNNVQLTDNLTTAFPAPAAFTFVGNLSSSGFGLNSNFNGNSDKNLLGVGNTLGVGETKTVSFTLNVILNGSPGPFNNAATATGASTADGKTTTDASANGTNPDPDGNGNPDENASTPLTFPPVILQIGLAKSVSVSAIQADGSYRITYTLTAKNYGNITLSNVQLTDDLSAVFPAPVVFAFARNLSSTGFTVNAGFNGSSDKNLLAPGNTLTAGETKTVSFILTISPNGSTGPFNNTATATGSSAVDGKTTTDASANGTNPDPDGNGIPDENAATPLTFPPPSPVIGAAKAVTRPVIQADGTYLVTYAVKVKNLGNVTLNNVQATDDLAATFPAPAVFALVSGSLSATRGLVVNPAFTGNGANTSLLAAGQSLGLADSSVISFTIKLTITTTFGPFANAVRASASGAGNTGNATDLSTNGTNPDPNGNGNPGDTGEDSPTVFSITPSPVIGIAKAAENPLPQPNTGSNNITYTLTLVNLGNVALSNVQASDDLGKAFATALFSIVPGSITATGGLTADLTFDGKNNLNLLTANQVLAVGASATVRFTVNITGAGSFSNTATATAAGPGSTGTTRDVSTNGTNPDPNSNGNPSDPGEDSPTVITLGTSDLIIPQGFSPNGDGKNDTFVITGQGLSAVHLEIYNRWGNVVYKNENYKNEWNGTCNTGIYFGQELPDGTYYYLINVGDGRKYVSFLTINR